MTQFDLDTFRTALRVTIEVALAAHCDPGDVAVVLREAAHNLADDGYVTAAADDYVYELPSDDPTVTTADVLAQVIAGSFGAVRIRVAAYELRHPGSEHWGSVWAIYDAETGTFVEWVNVGTFRSPRELWAYLLDVDPSEPGLEP